MRTLGTALLGLAVLLAGCKKAPQTAVGGKSVQHWVEALQAPDARLRKKAATKLGNVGKADPAVVPALIGALEDPEAEVRVEVILALVKLGPAARVAAPRLAELARDDPDEAVRACAGRALEKVRP
jgi:HEAT repeat protein